MHINRFWAAILLGIPLIYLVVFFITPLGMVVVDSFSNREGELTLENYALVLGDSYYWRVLGYTFWIALVTCVATLILGYPLAYYMSLIERRRAVRRLCFILILMPLFTSNIVRSFGWIVLLGREGLVNETLMWLGIVDRPLRLLSTEIAIIIGMIYVMLPFMVLAIASVLQNMNGALREAARDLGATAFSTFLKVTLPLSAPGIVAGTLIVFTLSISSYVTPRIMSGGRSVVSSMLIYDQFMLVFNPYLGSAIAVVLLVASFALIVAYTLLLERRPGRRASP
ncbi:putative spermidine/putrescine transport system permease protein [Ancylobacter aquaticus]|uniref:Putative spermidine/putrescine transport system permease protein n=1 Tax=Ancylobacter aquaticus TaxID=100 RepID=A0A4R1HZQ2_ANCAQ|nr:ABC transporter permease [Ancylobacter aquaticus]TCK28327.1 putative spermidine/putrescine transport system permease protein [Ancylobacter aquaticus]